MTDIFVAYTFLIAKMMNCAGDVGRHVMQDHAQNAVSLCMPQKELAKKATVFTLQPVQCSAVYYCFMRQSQSALRVSPVRLSVCPSVPSGLYIAKLINTKAFEKKLVRSSQDRSNRHDTFQFKRPRVKATSINFRTPKIPQHENHDISEMCKYFCTQFFPIV